MNILVCVLAFLSAFFWWYRSRNKANPLGFPLPPGPPRKAIIGNLLDIPRERAWHKFKEWKQEYGDIVYVEALGNNILILNTMEAVHDLLEKRPAVYSDRPTLVMLGELIGLDNSFPMLQYGARWRKHRKLAHAPLSPEAVKKYHGVQEDVIIKYIDSLLQSPENFNSELRLTAGRIVMSVTYGLPVHTPDDVYVTEAEDVMKMIANGFTPGAFLVDVIPSLKYLPSWLPFNHIHEYAADGRNRLYSLVSRPFEQVKRDLASGSAQPSFVSDCMKEYEEMLSSPEANEGEDNPDHFIRWIAGAMYGAGGETTYSTILSFMLAMALYPEVQEKAKEEIDRVVGKGRLPTINDRLHLPYVNAIIKESLRWKPALPLSIPRRTKKEDIYNGYYIPKGTVVMPNVWVIADDDKSGISPSKFAPERFLADHVKETATDPYSYAFGFGRRICPGRYLGENNLFFLVSGLMATIDISKQSGESLDPAFTAGLVSFPEPYKISIAPRSKEVVELVKERVAHIN